jgi:hypothetical protein
MINHFELIILQKFVNLNKTFHIAQVRAMDQVFNHVGLVYN